MPRDCASNVNSSLGEKKFLQKSIEFTSYPWNVHYVFMDPLLFALVFASPSPEANTPVFLGDPPQYSKFSGDTELRIRGRGSRDTDITSSPTHRLLSFLRHVRP